MRFLLYEIDSKAVAANTPPSPRSWPRWRAASLTQNARERDLLLERAATCARAAS